MNREYPWARALSAGGLVYVQTAVSRYLDNQCEHLGVAAEPVVARLSLGRVDCAKCAVGVHGPPVHPGQCDVCEKDGAAMFYPFMVRWGDVTVTGDCCPTCAGVMGISGGSVEDDGAPESGGTGTG